MREALGDDALLGQCLPGDSWAAWRTILIAALGEPLTADELGVFEILTGRGASPTEPVEELCVIVGRRSGKDRAISVLSAYIAGLIDHEMIALGEVGTLFVLSASVDQAATTFDYIDSIFQDDVSPLLSGLVSNRTQDTLTLKSCGKRIEIRVRPSHYGRLRGPTAIGAILNELAFWPSAENSLNPDKRVVEALRPSMMTTSGMMISISSPYAKSGELWRLFQNHFGVENDPALVIQAETTTLNPTIPKAKVARELTRDPSAARSEWLGEFRNDVEGYINRDVVQGCVGPGIEERTPDPAVTYRCFVDASSGNLGGDSMAMCIGHLDETDDVVIIDCIKEFKPEFNPSVAVQEFARLMSCYNVSECQGDKFASGFIAQEFDRHNISYAADAPGKSELYLQLIALLNSKLIKLLDNEKLVNQLVSLQRKLARNGSRESIDHRPGLHDDVANCCAGVAVSLAPEPEETMSVDHFSF